MLIIQIPGTWEGKEGEICLLSLAQGIFVFFFCEREKSIVKNVYSGFWLSPTSEAGVILSRTKPSVK